MPFLYSVNSVEWCLFLVQSLTNIAVLIMSIFKLITFIIVFLIYLCSLLFSVSFLTTYLFYHQYCSSCLPDISSPVISLLCFYLPNMWLLITFLQCMTTCLFSSVKQQNHHMAFYHQLAGSFFQC